MNIFFLSTDPVKAAQMACDKHVNKMIVESAQMLANAYSLEVLTSDDCPKTQKSNNRKHSYLHHPMSKWVLYSHSHWNWLLNHAISLCKEKFYRQQKYHFTEQFINWCKNNIPSLPIMGWSKPPLCMPYKYTNTDTIEAYRDYYWGEKRKFAVWTKRQKPEWWLEKEKGAYLNE